ncbi:MAG: Na+/H+ antiporter NhaA [Bacteroidetes bacterium]|nr:Na+/H+ antiporter NhaA [Bacteroidota bacterium]
MKKRNLFTSLVKFVDLQNISGILLLITTLGAMIMANSNFADDYFRFWNTEIGFSVGESELIKPLLLWVNDGLMAIFFFLIGLEIKREVLLGQLNSIRKIMFPLVGALGGIIFPVLFFFVLNSNPETVSGWGIPMATDIAFSLAVLNVLGKRVPLSLKIFLTAFAIVDDLAAVMVIALFYSSSIQIGVLIWALGLLLVTYFVSYKGFYSHPFIVIMGAIIWFLFLESGIHPTISGVLMAFAIPVKQRVGLQVFLRRMRSFANNFRTSKSVSEPILTKEQLSLVKRQRNWLKYFESPLQRWEEILRTWVSVVIIPIFALANAGVSITDTEHMEMGLITTIALCLFLGKSIGISSAVLISKKLKFIQVPRDIGIKEIIGVSFIAGIGFTMAIFIATLAFVNNPEYIDSAKIGILVGSLASAFTGYFLLRSSKKKDDLLEGV